MSGDLAPLLAFVSDVWSQFALVFLRCGAMAAVLPGFGERVIPMRFRLALAVILSLLVTPAAGQETVELGFPAAIAEALTGLFLGLLLRFMVFAIQITGAIAAQSTSLAQIFGGGVTPDPSPAIGNVLLLGALALFSLSGGHIYAVVYVLNSYAAVPLGEFPDPATLTKAGLETAGAVMRLGLLLAMPFVISGLLYNVVLGAINRAMPQLMVAFVGAPAITAGGLLLLALAGPLLLGVWCDEAISYAVAPPWIPR